MNPVLHLSTLPLSILIVQEGQVAYTNSEFHALLGTQDAPDADVAAFSLALLAECRRCSAPKRPGVPSRGSAAGRARVQLTRLDGSTFPAEVVVSEVVWDSRPASQLCVRDLTGEHQALAKLNGLASGSIEGILIHRDMRPLFVNDAYARMYGYDSKDQILQMQSILQLTDPEDRDKVWGYYLRRMKGETVPSRYVHRSRTKDGRQIFVDNLVTVVDWEGQQAVQVTNLDVTQYVAAQNVAEWDRQAVLGEAAAGMAKRFVQHSSKLSGELEQARLHAYMEGNGAVLERMRAMEGILQRMQEDLDALLVAARDGSQVEHAVDLKELLAEAVTERLRPANAPSIRNRRIRLSIEEDRAIPPVTGDRLHIKRVLNSILDNANEAMPHGGTVDVSLRATTLRRSNQSIPLGRYAVIEIADEGPGIDPAIAARLGEPFQSTKDGHAGIGLSTSLVVMKRHRGYLIVRPATPRGTRVTLYFPLVSDGDVAAAPQH